MSDVFDVLIDALKARAGEKHDLASTTATTNMIHGPSGIFGAAGLDRDVFSTRIRPHGLMQYLPSRGTVDVNPIVPYLTGFTDDASSTEKTAACDTPIEAGETKSCLQGALFGRYERKTDVLEVNKIGQRVNRGEFMDLRLLNDPILDEGFSVPAGIPREAARALNSEVLNRWLNVGVSLERKLGVQNFSGNPSNNTSGGYAEYFGLQTLVGTGKVDVITGDTCPALDSYVRNFNYSRVDTSTMDIVAELTHMWRYLNHIASSTGLDPVDFRFVMRRNLFHELADVWPCAYATYRCTVNNVGDSNIARVMTDGMAQRQMADDMRNGLYLMIDGVRVPVVIDDFNPEATDTTSANLNAGEFASDIYLLPFVVRGGILSLFMEFFDYSSSLRDIAIGNLGSDYWTDGGKFLWTSQRTGWCVEWWVKIEPRIRLLTPHLAGRIQNVAYAPLLHYREDAPGSAYFFDGGVTTRTNAPYDDTDF